MCIVIFTLSCVTLWKKKNSHHTTHSFFFLARALVFMGTLCFYFYGDCSFCVAIRYAPFNLFFSFIISHLLRQAELHGVARSDLDMWRAKINILPLWHRWQIAQHAQSSAVHSSEEGQSQTGSNTKGTPTKSPPSCTARHNKEMCLTSCGQAWYVRRLPDAD